MKGEIIHKTLKDNYPVILLIIIVFVVYLSTLLPGTGYTGDTAKFQYSARVLGLTHTPGYPLYSLVSHMFYLLPAGSTAFKINLMSAVFASTAVLLVYFIILFLIKNRVIAFASGLLLAFSRTFWSQSVVAEVYTMNAAFMAAVILGLLLWEKKKVTRYFMLTCFLYAMSLAHHPTTVLLLPALIYFIMMTDRKVLWNRKNLLWITGFFILAAIQYSYVFIRSHCPSVYVETEIFNIKDFIWWITGAQFRGGMFSGGLVELFSERIPFYVFELKNQFSFAGVLAGLTGACLMLRDKMKHAVFFLLIIAGNLFFTLNYNINDIFVFFIPTYIVFLIFIAFAFVALYRKLLSIKVSKINIIKGFRINENTRNKLVRCILNSMLALYLIIVFAVNLNMVNQKRNTWMDEFTEFILDNIKDNSIIFPLNYFWSQVYLYKLIGEEKRKGDGIKVSRDWQPSMIAETYPAYARNAGAGRKEAKEITEERNLYFHGRNREVFERAGFDSRKVVSISRDGYDTDIYEVIPHGWKWQRKSPVTRVPDRDEVSEEVRKAMDELRKKGSFEIDFTLSTRCLLDRGWAESALVGDVMPFCWANDVESTLSIQLKKPAGYRMRFKARPYVDENNQKQWIKVYLNEKYLSAIELENGWKPYTVDIPEGCWKKGWNRLKFRYNYVAGYDRVPDGESPRGLAVAFSGIKFEKEGR